MKMVPKTTMGVGQQPELSYGIVRCDLVGFARHGSGARDNKGEGQQPELDCGIARCDLVGFARHGSGAQDNNGEGNKRN